MPTLVQRLTMGWGKLRRMTMMTFAKRRVVGDLQRRVGACTRCGACCKLLFKCPAFDDADGNPKCLVYNDRPGVCSLFPINEKDLKDRDIVMPNVKCGFSFIRAGETIAPPAEEELPKKIVLERYFERGTKTISGPLSVMKFMLFQKNGHHNGSHNGKK